MNVDDAMKSAFMHEYQLYDLSVDDEGTFTDRATLSAYSAWIVAWYTSIETHRSDIAINALLVQAACCQCHLHDLPDRYLSAYPFWSVRPIYLLLSAYMMALKTNSTHQIANIHQYFFDKSIVGNE